MKQKIRSISLRINVWICVIPMVILFMLMTFIPIRGLQLLVGDMQLLDTMFKGYDGVYVHQLFERLQGDGRNAYLSLELYADIPFIFLYVVTFAVAIMKLLVKNELWESVLYHSLFFPILTGAFDLGENIGIIYMLKTKSNIPENIIQLTSFCTILKGYFLPLTLLTLFVLIGVMGYKKWRLSNKTTSI